MGPTIPKAEFKPGYLSQSPLDGCFSDVTFTTSQHFVYVLEITAAHCPVEDPYCHFKVHEGIFAISGFAPKWRATESVGALSAALHTAHWASLSTHGTVLLVSDGEHTRLEAVGWS